MFESRLVILALGLGLGGCTLASNGTGASTRDAAPEGGPGDSAQTTAADGHAPDGSSGMREPVDGSAPAVTDAEASDAGSAAADGSQPEDAGEAKLDAGVDPDASADGAVPDTGVDADVPHDGGSAPDSGLEDAMVPDAGDAASPGCGLTGRYALRIGAEVEWEAKRLFGLVPIVRAGEGDLSVTVLVDFDGEGTLVTGDVLPCDAIVPDFESSNIAGDEDYSVRFAPEVWESPTMPHTAAYLNLGCSIPGCVLTVDPLEVLLGAQTGEPFSPWPEDRADIAYPDDDNDGSDGLTIGVRGPEEAEGQYSYIPVGTSGTRTTAIHLGIRVGVSLTGALDDCDSLSGLAETFQIDTHVAGCATTPRGSPCSSSETQFLDDNLPQWTSRSVSFRGVRVAPGAGCQEARAAFSTP